ncbi:MAG: ImmA/IrrE family metallo-endopeptidase [Sandaracinaceae bacterium]|nr:ImmA/IrrE family metallo-endopeptidase [Sandaracinaceae bacterium]
MSLGATIAAQRQSLGLDLGAVASLSGLGEARVRAIEAGQALTRFELEALASALAIEPEALRTGELADPRFAAVRFRAPLGVTGMSPLDVRALARAAEAGRVHHFLRSLRNAPPSQVWALRSVMAVQPSLEPWKQGYALGQHARERLAPRHEPLSSVQELLERLGVLVVSVSLESPSIEAASLVERDASPVIVLNRSCSRFSHRLARRAVLAHELCHLLHDGGERDLLTVVSRDDDGSDVEKRAKGFAPSFLAPGAWIARPRPGASALEEVTSLGQAWGLSFEGACWHAKNLRRIPAKTAGAMATSAGQSIDPGDFEPELAREDPRSIGLDLAVSELGESALGDLAVSGARDELISVRRAAEILSFR